jgi:hypothetical protein
MKPLYIWLIAIVLVVLVGSQIATCHFTVDSGTGSPGESHDGLPPWQWD